VPRSSRLRPRDPAEHGPCPALGDDPHDRAARRRRQETDSRVVSACSFATPVLDQSNWPRLLAVDAARERGFAALSTNEHFVFQTPWLDGPTALASMIERSGQMTLATTVSLAVVRGLHAFAISCEATAQPVVPVVAQNR
jgi:hypothetical protein